LARPRKAPVVRKTRTGTGPFRIAPERSGSDDAPVALFEFKLEIPPAAAGPIEELLLEHGWKDWSVFDDVVARRSWLIGICADQAEATAQWRGLEPLMAARGIHPLGPPEMRALVDADWRDSYKAHFHPWQFGRLHWVPVWERATYPVPPGAVVLWLDPGLAFGTGNHETTRLCVERLVALAESRAGCGRVLDVGCGSGILALSAALLGLGEVAGFDHDPEAVRVSEENAAHNGLTGRVRFFVGDLYSGLAGRSADIVLANIQADVLARFARELTRAVAPGGALVLSGILAAENAGLRAAFAELVPKWVIDTRVMGEWSDLLLTAPAAAAGESAAG